MSLLAIDPGTTESGWVILDDHDKIRDSGIYTNDDTIHLMTGGFAYEPFDAVAIERFEARGMPLSDDSVETVLWTGRFIQAMIACGEPPILVKRSAVKLYLCGTTTAKDPNVRAALIDIFGPKGVKASPGGTYGVSKHAWAALGVAATVRKLERTD